MRLYNALERLRRGRFGEALAEMERWRLEEPRKWMKLAELLQRLGVTSDSSVAEAVEACVQSWRGALWRCVCKKISCDPQIADLLFAVFAPLCRGVVTSTSAVSMKCLELLVKTADRLHREAA